MGITYAAARIWVVASASPSVLPDSYAYARIAELPVGLRFFTEFKPWGVPLFYKLLPEPLAVWAPIGQVILSSACWLLLAIAVSRSFRDQRLRVISFTIVLAFSLATAITQWDALVLSESLSLSFFALFLAACLELMRRPTALSVTGAALAALLFTGARDANGYLAFLVLFPLALIVAVRGRRSVGIALSCAAILILTAHMWAASNPRRWELLLTDAIQQRVLDEPEARAFFIERGMPYTKDLRGRVSETRHSRERFEQAPDLAAFRRWLRAEGKRTHIEYLLGHPSKLVGEPLAELPTMVSPAGMTTYKPPGQRSVLPRWLERGLYVESAASLLVWAVLALLIATLAAFAGVAARVWLVPVLAMITVVPQAIIVWMEPMEVGRHALVLGVTLRVAVILLILFLVDALLVTRRLRRVAVEP